MSGEVQLPEASCEERPPSRATVAECVQRLHAAMVSEADVQELESDVARLGDEDLGRMLRDLTGLRGLLTFSDVPFEEMERLQASGAADGEATRRRLSGCMGLSEDTSFRSEILAEYHYNNFRFCQEAGFSAVKASTVLSIMRVLHAQLVASKSPLPEQMGKELLEVLLLRHSQHLPPDRFAVLTPCDVAKVREHAGESFFRLLKMYAYVYRQSVEVVVRLKEEHALPLCAAAAPLHVELERDPRTVPQLKQLYAELRDPEEAAVDAAKALEERPALDPEVAEVEAAINASMEAHLERLQHRLHGPA